MKSLLFSLASGLLSVTFPAVAQVGTRYTASDYEAQDNLLAHWDGIENAGRGVRDEKAQTWVDLTGKHTDFVFPNGPVRLNGNCFTMVATSDGKDHGCYIESCADIAHAIYDTDKVATIEVVCDFASAVGGVFVACYDDQGASGRILEAAAGPNWGGIYHCMNVVNFCSEDWGNYRQLEMGVLNRVRTYVFSCQSSVMKIMKDGGAFIGNINRGNAVCNLDKAWLSLGFPRAPSGIAGASAPDVKIYAVRVYDRQLTADELARNWAVDQARFLNGDYKLKPVLEIAGDPLPAGTPAPGYGQVLGLEEGVSTNCTAPAVVSEGGVTATCLGWELRTYDEATQQWIFSRQSGADDKLACIFTMGTSDARLVWKWDARVAPASKIRTVGKGQVQASAASVVLGEKVTFTAVPNTGFVFDHWEGEDVPAGQDKSDVIEVSVNDLSPLTAVFLPDGTGAYEARDYVAQDHLLAHWDGIENAGRGYRDEKAQTWVDLTGKHDDFAFPNGPDYRDGKCYYLGKGADGCAHSAGVTSVEDIARAIAGGKATVEVVYEFNSMVSESPLVQCSDQKNDLGRIFWTYVNQTYAIGCVDYLETTWKISNFDSSPRNSILSYSFCFEDRTIKKNGANTGRSFGKGALTPDYSKVGLAVGSFFNWANGEWVMQPAVAANDAKIYAVRVYDRQLTADELARNWAVDQTRFVEDRYLLATGRQGLMIIFGPSK